MARVLIFLWCWSCATVWAQQPLQVAVSSEFASAAEALARAYGKSQVVLTAGSSGVLATRIASGHGFDLFISSDEKRIRQLTADGHVIGGSDTLIARDGLVLWAPDFPSLTLDHLADVPRLVIANPIQSAYGIAAQQVLERLQLWRHLGNRLIRVEHGALAYEHVARGSVPAGLVPRSALVATGRMGEAKAIADDYYGAIHYYSAVVTAGNRNEAEKFMRFILTSGKEVIKTAGFQ